MAALRCYDCVRECRHDKCQRCDKMPANNRKLDGYLKSQVFGAGGIESQDAEAMAVEAEASANAAPMPMAENAAAPRRETRQCKNVVDSTPEQPT